MPLALSDMYPEFTQLLLQTQFFREYDMFVPVDWMDIAMVVPSTKDAETYATLTQVPRMGLWEGERRFASAGSKQSVMVFNQKYDAGIKFPRTVFADDQYGILMQQIAYLAQEGKRMPTELIYNVLQHGVDVSGQYATVGIDGQPLFSQSHPGKTATDTQSNTVATTATLNIGNLNTAVTAMKKFYDNTGRPMGIIPDTLIVPPDLEMTARQLLHSTFLMSVGSSTSNTPVTNIPTFNVFSVEGGGALKRLISTPYLNYSATQWYVACSTRQTKPVLLQERQPPELTVKMDPNTSDLVMMEDNIFASIMARWGAAPGSWHTVYQGSE